VPSSDRNKLFDRLAILKYGMRSLHENHVRKTGYQEFESSRVMNPCPGGSCNGGDLQQYQRDNTLSFLQGAPAGCYPIFDRTDGFAVKDEAGFIIFKHCPNGTEYTSDCSCTVVSWWDSWGRCAAGILGAGALAGAALTTPTVFGIPIGAVVGVVAGAATGAASFCGTP